MKVMYGSLCLDFDHKMFEIWNSTIEKEPADLVKTFFFLEKVKTYL